jgi:outer membrane protein OmpA-like peptidoglycan-associated protein
MMRRFFIVLAALFVSLASACRPPEVPKPVPVEQPKADADGDGIPDDGTDKCLNEKEDGLPPDPTDGCKSTDPDGDGIVGDADKCPNEKEDGLPPDPKDGCASVDPDGDGIIAPADQCPNEPETKNGYQDADGCADTPRVVVTKTEVKISEKIMFAFAKATIEPVSQNLLDEIAFVINDNPQIEYIEVAGHADKIGTEPFNVQLTKRRAQAVLDALIKRKVDPRRMHARGYGNYCQVDPGDAEASREKNRRVEFKIMRIGGVETGVALGCESAAAKGISPLPVPKTAPTQADLQKVKDEHPPTPPPRNPNPPPAATAATPAPDDAGAPAGSAAPPRVGRSTDVHEAAAPAASRARRQASRPEAHRGETAAEAAHRQEEVGEKPPPLSANRRRRPSSG